MNDKVGVQIKEGESNSQTRLTQFQTFEQIELWIIWKNSVQENKN